MTQYAVRCKSGVLERDISCFPASRCFARFLAKTTEKTGVKFVTVFTKSLSNGLFRLKLNNSSKHANL